MNDLVPRNRLYAYSGDNSSILSFDSIENFGYGWNDDVEIQIPLNDLVTKSRPRGFGGDNVSVSSFESTESNGHGFDDDVEFQMPLNDLVTKSHRRNFCSGNASVSSFESALSWDQDDPFVRGMKPIHFSDSVSVGSCNELYWDQLYDDEMRRHTKSRTHKNAEEEEEDIDSETRAFVEEQAELYGTHLARKFFQWLCRYCGNDDAVENSGPNTNDFQSFDTNTNDMFSGNRSVDAQTFVTEDTGERAIVQNNQTTQNINQTSAPQPSPQVL